MNNWKDKLNNGLSAFFLSSMPLDLFLEKLTKKQIDFISTEIIEKIIDEIPNEMGMRTSKGFIEGEYLKQQLKDKWLK